MIDGPFLVVVRASQLEMRRSRKTGCKKTENR
jgi:hypothetical protein